jgi:hypothetical protein
MKFLVLRTDLKKKLKNIKLLIVDSRIFTAELDEGLDSIVESTCSAKLSRFVSDNIRVILCSDSSNGNNAGRLDNNYFMYSTLDGLTFKEFIDRACDDYKVKMREVAFINVSAADRNLLSNLNFSVATIDAPLEIKTNSYYVSNFTGSKTFNEIIELICFSKNT